MDKYVAFMRALNVAGHASVRMTDLRDAFAAASCRKVRTYIQSGNVIFESPARDAAALVRQVRTRLRRLLDTDPAIVFRTLREIEDVVKRAPFKNVETEPGIKLYVAFLFEPPRSRPRFPLVSSKEALATGCWASRLGETEVQPWVTSSARICIAGSERRSTG